MKLVYAGDAINPRPPSFDLSIEDNKMGMPVSITQPKILEDREMKNTKGIRAFLHDAKAVSPAIATLILIVIAAVAAAGVGLLVQNSQKNAQDQTSNKNLDVMGTLNIKGSTTVLPISQSAATEFMKKYPAVTINVAGGGSDIGQLLAWTTTSPTEDIGASSSKWSTDDKTINGILIPKRATAIIQEAGENAKIYETKIGTGMIVVAGRFKDTTSGEYATSIVVSNTAPTAYAAATKTLTINFGDLQKAYTPTDPSEGEIAVGTDKIKIIQRSDPSGTEETFAKWVGEQDSTTKQLAVSTTKVLGYQGNQGVRDAIAGTPATGYQGTVGFVDVGFTGSNVNGNVNTLAAGMDNAGATVKADSTTKGVGAAYDTASDVVNGAVSAGLARDLFYYNQGLPTNAIKAFLDWMLTPDGQKIVQNEGFFSS